MTLNNNGGENDQYLPQTYVPYLTIEQKKM